MPRVWKQVVRPGTFWIKGVPRTFTDPEIDHFLTQGKKMVAKGLPIRFPLEHQSWADPDKFVDGDERKAKETLYNKGFVTDYKKDENGALWSEIDVPDEEFAKKLEKEIRYVSPRIRKEFQDADGEVWNNVITHVAATPVPVDFRQSPFGTPLKEGEAAVVMSALQWSDTDLIDFSLADQVEKKDGKWDYVDMGYEDPGHPANRHADKMTESRFRVKTIMQHPSADAPSHEKAFFHRQMEYYHAHQGVSARDPVEKVGHNQAERYHYQEKHKHLDAFKAGVDLSVTDMGGMEHSDDPLVRSFASHAKPYSFAMHGSESVHTLLNHPDSHAPKEQKAAFHRGMADYHENRANRYSSAGELEKTRAHTGAMLHHYWMSRVHSGLGSTEAGRRAISDTGHIHPETEMSEMEPTKDFNGVLQAGEQKAEEQVGEGSNVQEHFERARDLLKKDPFLVELPDHCDSVTGWEHLCTALANKIEPDSEEPEEEERQAREEPMTVSMSQAETQMQARLVKAEGKLAATRKKGLLDELEHHFSRKAISPAKAKALAAKINAMTDMSLLDDESVESKVIEAKLEEFREIEDGALDMSQNQTADLGKAKAEPKAPWDDLSEQQDQKLDAALPAMIAAANGRYGAGATK